MTTPPPPPPSASGPPSAGGPPPQPTPPASPGAGRKPWWTAGRVVLAIVVVLVLMGGAGTAGFFLGAAWTGAETIGRDIAEDINRDFSGESDFSEGGDFSGGSVGPTVEGTALRVGDTARGTLDGGEAEHELTVDSSVDVTMDLRSDDFDPTLTVLDETGEEIAHNDDISLAEDRNSRIEISLAPGTYTLVVGAFGSGEGDYELSVG